MPHLSVSQRLKAAICIWLYALLTSSAAAQVSPAAFTRLVDFIDVTEHETQVDVNIQFGCSLRYVTHMPSSQGSVLRIQLRVGPDCGISPTARISPELPSTSGGENVIASATVDSDLPEQITLTITWKRAEKYVLIQGANLHGLRLRLIDRVANSGKILLSEPPAAANNFAVNLESQSKPFDADVVQLAQQRLGVPLFISEAEVDGQKWYRLRAGPIRRRDDAERLLQLALPSYPRAWLAIGDDAVTTSSTPAPAESALPAVETIGSDPLLDAATLSRLLKQSRTALSARDYPKAIQLLTQLQRQPEFPQRAQAQELLGLARERSGQLAHAKAEYQEYLQRYPEGEAAERVRNRLRILRAASLQAHTGGPASSGDHGWIASGGVSQLFRYDGLQIDNSMPSTGTTTPTTQKVNQNALFNDIDLLVRRRGERFDLTARTSAGYAKAFAGDGSGDQKRVTTALIQMADSMLGILARLGRQSRNGDGVLGTFDGLFASYQWRPSWALNTTVGFPVEQTSAAPNTARRFESVAIAYTPQGAHWDASAFVITQQFDGVRDRQAVGFEGRYLGLGKSLVGMIDYDTSFQSLNAIVLLGTLQLPARWNVSVDLERRNSPVLTTRNALIGQPVTTLRELEQTFTQQEILQFARDRTPITSNYAVSVSRPLGERFQFSTTVSATDISATTASGGVDAQPASGMQLSYQMQLYGSNLWTAGDFNVLNLVYTNADIGQIASAGVTTRLPIGGAWRIGPRLTVNHRVLATDNSAELTVLPSLLLDYQHDRKLLQFEAGGQLGKRDALQQTQNTKRYYVSLSYRIGF